MKRCPHTVYKEDMYHNGFSVTFGPQHLLSFKPETSLAIIGCEARLVVVDEDDSKLVGQELGLDSHKAAVGSVLVLDCASTARIHPLEKLLSVGLDIRSFMSVDISALGRASVPKAQYVQPSVDGRVVVWRRSNFTQQNKSSFVKHHNKDP